MRGSTKLADLLLAVWLQGIVCQNLPKLLSSPTAAAKQGQLSHALAIAPVSQLAAAPSPSAPVSDCEHKVLQLLGWEEAYNPNGYSINAELPPNCSLQTWQSLGCLKSLTNLTLTGSLFNLPDAWATNGSFPTLQAVNFSTAQLRGPLPDTWAQNAAFPQLRLLNLSETELSGTLPAAWAQTGAFSQLVELHLGATIIQGIVLLCTTCYSTLQLLWAAVITLEPHSTEAAATGAILQGRHCIVHALVSCAKMLL